MSKQLILLALGILVLGLSFVAFYWPHGIYKTFSQHVAPKRISIYYYFLLFAIVLPILFAFFAKYLIPELQLPTILLYLVAVSSICQLSCTLVPEVGGRKTTIHQIFAGVSALLLIMVLILVAANNNISSMDRLAVIVCTLLMTIVVGFVAFWKKTKLPTLLLQAGYFSLFFIAILFVTY
jgi:hypothetical protein